MDYAYSVAASLRFHWRYDGYHGHVIGGEVPLLPLHLIAAAHSAFFFSSDGRWTCGENDNGAPQLDDRD